MAKYSSADIGYLLLSQYNLTGVSSKLEDSVEAPVEDITPFGVNQAVLSRATNFKKYTVSGHDGWYDDAAGSIDASMVGMSSSEEVFMMAYQGNTVGKRAVCTAGAIRVGYKRGFEVGQYHKASFDIGVSGVRDEAYIVSDLTIKTGSGNNNGTYVDLGSGGGGSAGATVYVNVLEYDNGGTATGLTITFQDAATIPTWGSQHVCTPAITAVGGYHYHTTTQAVRRYLSCSWAWGGTVGTAHAEFTVAVGIN